MKFQFGLKTERESSGNLTWGKGNPTADNYSRDMCCINSDCKRNGILMNVATTEVVGVKELPSELQREGRSYAVICECPECFSQYWSHLPDESAKLYFEGKKCLEKDNVKK